MRIKFFTIGLIAVITGLLLASCGREDPLITEKEMDLSNDSGGHVLLGGGSADTCNTTSCIEDFLDNCNGSGWLVVLNDNDPYFLGSHYFVSGGDDEMRLIIEGNSAVDRPVLKITTPCNYPYYGSVHFAGPAATTGIVTLKDLVLVNNVPMSPNSPGIMFEVPNVDASNVAFDCDPGQTGTTFFMSTGKIKMTGCELAATQDFTFGPEDWCGLSSCGGYGNPMPADSSEIKNSVLYGDVIFDVYRATPAPDTSKFFFSDNYLVTSVAMNTNAGSKLKVVMAGNTFAQSAGAIIDIGGDFTVDAWGNETQKGPCRSDALSDFDTSNSSIGSGALELTTWKYNGITYDIPEIQNVGYNRVNNTITVNWMTPYSSSSVVQWGYSGSALSNTETGLTGTIHQVAFDVPSNEGCIYLRAISAVPGCPCEADTSDTVYTTKDILISNIQTSFSPLMCAFTVTWTTNVKSSSSVYYGPSCLSLPGSANGSSNTTNHSVICDVSELSGSVFAFKVRSGNSCDLAESNCSTTRKQKCFGQ